MQRSPHHRSPSSGNFSRSTRGALGSIWIALIYLLATPATAQHLHVYDSTPFLPPQQYPPLSTCTGVNLQVDWGPGGAIGTPPYTITWSGAATGSTSGVTSLPRWFPSMMTPVANGQPLTATLRDASGVLASADYGPVGGPAVGWQASFLAGHVSGDVTDPPGGTAQLQVDLFSPYAAFNAYAWIITWSDGFVENVTDSIQNPVHYRQVSPTTTTVYTADIQVAGAVPTSALCGGVHTTGSATVTISTPAQASNFGNGCYSVLDAASEYFTFYGSTDVCTTGTSITFLRSATNDGYEMSATPGTYRVPPANAPVLSTQNDAYATIPLSSPMPTPNGTTSTLTVNTNGFIVLSANQPIAAANSHWPSQLMFEALPDPTICAPWYDWDPSAGGRLVYEELNGLLYVTWESVLPTGSVGAGSTFQYQFHLPTGSCTIVYHDMHLTGVQPWHVLLFGLTTGNAVQPGAFDLSAELANGLDIHDTGSAPLSLDSNLPRLGANWELTTANVDAISPIAITFLSTGSLSFPVDLILLGIDAPDCFIHINTQILGSLTAPNVGGSSVATLPIPSDPSLTGSTLAAQSICLTLANNGKLLSSNGRLGTLGN